MSYGIGTRLERIMKIGTVQDTYQIKSFDLANNTYRLRHEQDQNPTELILESKESLDRYYTIIDNPKGHF